MLYLPNLKPSSALPDDKADEQHSVDKGCRFSTLCITCPLVKCWEDMSHSERFKFAKAFKKQGKCISMIANDSQ